MGKVGRLFEEQEWQDFKKILWELDEHEITQIGYEINKIKNDFEKKQHIEPPDEAFFEIIYSCGHLKREYIQYKYYVVPRIKNSKKYPCFDCLCEKLALKNTTLIDGSFKQIAYANYLRWEFYVNLLNLDKTARKDYLKTLTNLLDSNDSKVWIDVFHQREKDVNKPQNRF